MSICEITITTGFVDERCEACNQPLFVGDVHEVEGFSGRRHRCCGWDCAHDIVDELNVERSHASFQRSMWGSDYASWD